MGRFSLSPGQYNVTVNYTVSSSNTLSWNEAGERPRLKIREMGTMEILYCTGSCHDFTKHDVYGRGRAYCVKCQQFRLCSLCQAVQCDGHKCPEKASSGIVAAWLWCSYCETTRECRPKEGETRWRCQYCGSSLTCPSCATYWRKGHDCHASSAEETRSADVVEVPITIGSGIEMTVAVLPHWRTRVMALGPRLYAGPTYRGPVERAVLAMDRALRSGNESLASDLLDQAEALAEAG